MTADKNQVFCENILSVQKIVLPLQPLSKKADLSNGIKAITSDFGSEDLGSIPG